MATPPADPSSIPAVRRVLLPLAAALGVVYVASLAAVANVAVVPTIPFAFLFFLLLLAAPWALVLHAAGGAVERSCGGSRSRGRVAGLLCGALLLIAYRPSHLPSAAMVLALAAWLMIKPARTRPAGPEVVPFTLVLGCLFLGYASVWNGNYVVLALAGHRLQDATLLGLDLWAYAWLFGSPVDVWGLFPLITHPLGFDLLERGYLFLFPQIFIALMLAWGDPARIRRLLIAIFLAYAAGLSVFLLYPAVGPCLFEPDSFSTAFHGTATHRMMSGMNQEYQAIVGSGQSVNGFGYFVALPSLHVTMACLLQAALRASRFHFWVVLPMNAVLIASTVLLGYHYLLDVPAGILLAVPLLPLVRASGPRD